MVIIVNKKFILRMIILSIFIVLSSFSIYRLAAIVVDKNHHPDTIEIFDINNGSVTKVVPINNSTLTEAKKILKGITSIYLKANILPEKGYIIKMPLEPNIKVKNRWFIEYDLNPIDKMFIFLPNEGAPYLMVMDKKERPYLFNFKGDTDKLLKNLKFEAH